MATDKRHVTDLFGAGNVVASGVVPPSGLYQQPRTLSVPIEGKNYDVLSFDPQSARGLISRINNPISSRIQYFTTNSPESILWAQIVKKHWHDNLGIEVDILAVDFPTWLQGVKSGSFRHVAASGSSGSYVDPVWFLDLFDNSNGYGTHWSDPRYRAMLGTAKSTSDPAMRLASLARCEFYLLRAMPVLPLAHWVTADLIKPFVPGLGNNLLDRQQLKYVWIDTKWRSR